MAVHISPYQSDPTCSAGGLRSPPRGGVHVFSNTWCEIYKTVARLAAQVSIPSWNVAMGLRCSRIRTSRLTAIRGLQMRFTYTVNRLVLFCKHCPVLLQEQSVLGSIGDLFAVQKIPQQANGDVCSTRPELSGVLTQLLKAEA